MMVTLKELTPVVETLNQKRNEVNEIIAELNAKLAKLNVGIETVSPSDIKVGGWQPESNGDDWVSRSRTCSQLGYAKINDKWQLAIYEYEDTQAYEDGNPTKDNYGNDVFESSDGSWTALLEAPRSLRIKALAHLESLVTELQAQSLEELKIIEQARDLANKM